jgi:hypothetical protein
VNPNSIPLAWSPGDNSEVSVVVVYIVLAGAGFAIVLGTGLLAYWLERRARRASRLEATPVPRPRLPITAAPAESAAPLIDLDRPRVNGHRIGLDAARIGDISGEYALLRAAATRAATVAAEARSTSVEAASALSTAERDYEEARRAHAESLAAATPPISQSDAARTREFELAEIRARQQYHAALAGAKAARQAEYVAETAVRALGAEAAAAGEELEAIRATGTGTGAVVASANANGTGAGWLRRFRRPATGVAR